MDRLNLLPKETFALVFNPYGLPQSNGQSDITFETIVINNCIKLYMRRHHLDLLLNHYEGSRFFGENTSQYCFQEEIMQKAIDCGFSEGEADDLRRDMGKKQTEKLELYLPCWVAKYGETSWQTMTEQRLYAYPKAHAVTLAHLAYTTAYLKTHFPQEFTRAALRVAASDEY